MTATLPSQPQMFLKSFFADSVEETLDRARIELGPDALLLNQRDAPPECRHLGAFEVVFGVRPAETRTRPQPSGGATPASAAGLQAILERIEKRRASAAASRPDPTIRPQLANPPNLRTEAAVDTQPQRRSSIAQLLVGDGVDPSLATNVEDVVLRRLRLRNVVQIGRAGSPVSWNTNDLIKETIDELERRFEVAPHVGRRCLLVGPPGAGKTTTLVKLAVVRGLALGRAVRLVSMDDSRIGAVEQLQKYASILNVPFCMAGTPEALAQVINATPAETLLLIDTPGETALTMEDSGHRLADFLRHRQDIDTHLILTASMREADLRRTVDRFLVFSPAKLLFTRVDETEATGSMFSEAVRTGKPISFFCTGQTVPEDIVSATKARITRPLARQLPQALQTVA